MRMPVRFTTTINTRAMRAVQGATKYRLLIGIPASANTRVDPQDPGALNNAALLYIHENGSAAAHIPARPSLHPGVDAVRPQIIALLRQAARQRLASGAPDDPAIRRAMNQAGLLAVSSVRNVIRSKIPPDLADYTKAARLRRKRAYQTASPARQITMMAAWMAGDFTPLLDTGKLIQAITYVIRSR